MSERRQIAPSKRDALLRAAKDLLWERGYEGMSPRDVLDRSGAGQGSLYHHFTGKLDLACAALEEMAEEEGAAIDEIFALSKPPLQRIADYLMRERAALRGCRLARLANETAMEQRDFRGPVANFLQGIENHLTEALRQARLEGRLAPEVDETSLAAMFLAIVEGGFVLARAHWDESRMTAALDGARIVLAELTRPK